MLENFKKGVKKIFMAQAQCDKTSAPKEQAIKISAHCAKSKTTYCNDTRYNRETLIDVFNQCKVSNIRAMLKESGRTMTEMLGAIEQTLSEFDFFEPIGLCFKYILIFLVGIC